jgi:hypothetical protein
MHHRKNVTLSTSDANFAAQHFLQMILSIPQMRALSLDTSMNAEELDAWPRRTVALFLGGLNKFTSSLG